MLDIIIRGGDVVTPQGVMKADIGIAGETIAAVAAPGALAAGLAKREIDATAKIVMPGGIDPHVHLHHGWMKPDGTWLTTAGPEQVGRAARSLAAQRRSSTLPIGPASRRRSKRLNRATRISSARARAIGLIT